LWFEKNQYVILAYNEKNEKLTTANAIKAMNKTCLPSDGSCFIDTHQNFFIRKIIVKSFSLL